MDNNNKLIIWITCTVSVLIHVIALLFGPSYSPPDELKIPNLKTFNVQLAEKNELTPTQSKLTPKKAKVKEKEIKNELKPEQKPKQATSKKPEKKEAEKKPIKSPPLPAPSTSKKQKTDEELAEFGGDRRKGSLKGSAEGTTKESKAKIAKTEKIEETAPSPQPITPEKTDLASTQSTKPKPSQPSTSEKNNDKSDHNLKTDNKPSKLPKHMTDVANIQSEKKPLTTSSVSSEHKGRIKISQEATQKTKSSSKSNPLFDAINQAKPAQHLTQEQIGNLKQLGESGLNQARLGDPFSSFEKKQRRVFNQFLAIMSEQVNEHWEQPKSEEWLLTRIRLYLTLEGFIKDVYIEESSGDKVFDERALKAVRAVKQYHMPDSLAAAGYLTRLTMTIDNYSEPEE